MSQRMKVAWRRAFTLNPTMNSTLVLTMTLAMACTGMVAVDTSSATGPSSLEISIVPLAVSEDQAVLFKTKKAGNASGGHSRLAFSAEYGWICIEANGKWQEWIHTEVDWHAFSSQVESETAGKMTGAEKMTVAEKESTYLQLYDDAETAFDKAHFVEDPASPVTEALAKCRGKAWRAAGAEVGRGRATWRPDRFCVDGRCANQRIVQRTLGAGLSSGGDNAAIEATFFFHGVALFNNVDEPDKRVGAGFDVKNSSCEGCSYEITRISGISLAPDQRLVAADD